MSTPNKPKAQIKREIIQIVNEAGLFTCACPRSSNVYVASPDHDVTISQVTNLLAAYKGVLSFHPVGNGNRVKAGIFFTSFDYVRVNINL